MADGLYRAPFERAMPRFIEVAWGDLAALEAVFDAHRGQIAGVLAEVVQVESGVRRLSREWLACARSLCDRDGALLLFDEVQSGLGRTGTLRAFQRDGVEPDAFAVAKALDGGSSRSAPRCCARACGSGRLAATIERRSTRARWAETAWRA